MGNMGLEELEKEKETERGNGTGNGNFARMHPCASSTSWQESVSDVIVLVSL